MIMSFTKPKSGSPLFPDTPGGSGAGSTGGPGAVHHHVSRWYKIAALAAGILLLLASGGSVGRVLIIGFAVVGVALDCQRHPVHILRYAAAAFVCVLLAGTAVVGPVMHDMGEAGGSLGDRGLSAIGAWKDGWHTPSVEMNTGGQAVVTPPSPPAPAPAAVGAEAQGAAIGGVAHPAAMAGVATTTTTAPR
jgi:hypothetical protein